MHSQHSDDSPRVSMTEGGMVGWVGMSVGSGPDGGNWSMGVGGRGGHRSAGKRHPGEGG